MTTITTAARRIARRLNSLDSGHSGGFCVFGADGSGGYWYSSGSQPALDKSDRSRLNPTTQKRTVITRNQRRPRT